MSDLKKLHHSFGIELVYNEIEWKMIIIQRKYINDAINRLGMESSKIVATPLDTNVKVTKSIEMSREEMNNYPFQQLVGSLMYLTVSTRQIYATP